VRRRLIDALACPRTKAPYDLDPVRVAGDEVVEGFLVSRDEREVRPLVAGVGVLPLDLAAHLRTHANVYARSPINDPRLARFLLSQASTGHDRVPFDEVVGHYRDLAAAPPDGYDTAPHPEDVALRALLADVLGAGRTDGVGLVVGSGVGRAAFVLARHRGTVLGVDRSIACVRRARNIAVTTEHFFLPAPKGSGLKEIPLDLAPLERRGVDFAVADAHALPLAAARADVVVLMARDAEGDLPDRAAAVGEALRVLGPGGLLAWHADLGAADGRLPEPAWTAGPFRAGRLA
jgi:SAM-dependent methyltransferase/uncharacterized protein YbaR (Trm112 family)